MSPNRVVALVTAAFGLAAAVAVPLANVDWTSAAGIIAGLGVVFGVAYKWLDGWQKHEANVFLNTGLPVGRGSADELQRRATGRAMHETLAKNVVEAQNRQAIQEGQNKTSGGANMKTKPDAAYDAVFGTPRGEPDIKATDDEDSGMFPRDPSVARQDLDDLELPSASPVEPVIGPSNMKD